MDKRLGWQCDLRGLDLEASGTTENVLGEAQSKETAHKPSFKDSLLHIMNLLIQLADWHPTMKQNARPHDRGSGLLVNPFVWSSYKI